MATPSSTLFRASRPAFRSQFFTLAIRRSAGRRWQSSDAGTGTGGAGGTSGSAPHESWFQRAWNSPVGVKTVHFWYLPPFPSQQQQQHQLTLLVPGPLS